MFIETLFMIGINQEATRKSFNRCMDKETVDIHTMEYYSVIKRAINPQKDTTGS